MKGLLRTTCLLFNNCLFIPPEIGKKGDCVIYVEFGRYLCYSYLQ